MPNQDIHVPLDYSLDLRKLETTDLAHPDTFNPLFERLINNDAFMSAFALALAGVGWTNQTVKGVSDAQVAHMGAADPHTQYALDTDLDTHKAETAIETVKGHVELATAAETTAGTDNTRAVHPAGLKVELDKKLALALLTTQGDIPYATAAGIWARLAKGAAYQALGMNAGATAPQYMVSLQSLLTAAGDIIYASGANTPARLAKGTASQLLSMNAGATAPEWKTVSLSDGAWEKIAEIIVDSSAPSTLAFSSIPSTYRLLKIIGHQIVSSTTSAVGLWLRFNDDSSSYSYYDASGQSSQIDLPNLIVGNAANFRGLLECSIANNAAKKKTLKSEFVTSSSSVVGPKSHGWGNDSVVISKISLISSSPASAQFGEGTTFELWGVK